MNPLKRKAQDPPLLLDGQITIQNQRFVYRRLGVGVYHDTFALQGAEELKLVDQSLRTDAIVIRMLKATLRTKQKASFSKKDGAGYAYYHSHHVPLPECYGKPEDYGCWILERMPTVVTCDGWKAKEKKFDDLDPLDKKILLFVKKYITTSQNPDEKLQIFNFLPNNLMLDSQNEPRFVDFSLKDEEDDELPFEIYRQVLAWSNGNEHIFEWLIEDFGKDMQTSMRFTRKNHQETTTDF